MRRFILLVALVFVIGGSALVGAHQSPTNPNPDVGTTQGGCATPMASPGASPEASPSVSMLEGLATAEATVQASPAIPQNCATPMSTPGS